MKYRSVILLLKVGLGDRQTLKRIEGQKFDTIEDIQKEVCFDEYDPIAVEDLTILELTDFVDNCNDTDSASISQKGGTNIGLENTWIGHILLKVN